MDNFGFDVFDLTGATVAGESLMASPLQFDRTEYTPFEQFVENLHRLPDKPVRVPIRNLNVNGRVVSDRMDKYLAAPGESSSALKEALKTPRHYLIYKNQILTPPNADHFELGTFIHQAFLEPSKFERVKVEPKHDETTNSGLRELIMFYWMLLEIAQDEDLSALNRNDLRFKLQSLRAKAKEEGYTMIEEEYLGIVKVIRSTYNIYGDGMLAKMFRYIRPEVSMYGKDPITGVTVKIRPDGLLLEENFGINAILSFKTTSASTVEEFMRDCAKYRYELSEGMYLDVASNITGRKFTATVMIMVQTAIPFQIAVLYWNDEDLAVGKYKYAQALDIIKQCNDARSWPGFDSKAEAGSFGIIQMKLPEYIKSELLPQYIPDNT